jgi:hypothetical protein
LSSVETCPNAMSVVDDDSVVPWLQPGCFSTPLEGDLHRNEQQLLPPSARPLAPLVLKAPHHGGKASLTLPSCDLCHRRAPARIHRCAAVGAAVMFEWPLE